MNTCSSEFYEAFKSGVSSSCVTCGCGRTHFNLSGEWADSEKEYDETLENSKIKPNEYQVMDMGEYASLINLGVEYVDGCDCGIVLKYQDWLWKHRANIIKYIKARNNKEQKELEKLQQLSKDINDL